jgi:hypothetical protein
LDRGYSVEAIDLLDEALTTAMFLRVCTELPPTTAYETQKEIHEILLTGKLQDLYAKIEEVASECSWTVSRVMDITRAIPKWSSDLNYRSYVTCRKRAFTEGSCTGTDGLPLLFDIETGELRP